MNQHSELECSHCTQVCIQLYIRHTPDPPPSAPPLTWSANPALLRALYSSSLWSGPVCSVDHSQRPPLGRWRQAGRYSHGQGGIWSTGCCCWCLRLLDSSGLPSLGTTFGCAPPLPRALSCSAKVHISNITPWTMKY